MTTVRLRHLVQVNPPTRAFDRMSNADELTFLPMEAVWPGSRLDISQRRRKVSVATGYTRFQDGDVLVPKITPTFEAGRAVLVRGLLGGVGVGTTELHVLRPGPRVDARFLLYVVNTHGFLKRGAAEMYGVAGQQRVPDAFLRDLPILLPVLEEQCRIADFLDAETARIDQLIELRARSLSLLTERMSSALDIIVRGSSMEEVKEADYVPLGKIPARWREGRLRSVDCDVQTGPFGSQLHAEDYTNGAWPVINPANITPAGLVADERVTVGHEVRGRLARHILRAGDVVFGRRGELGRAAVVESSQEGWVCGTGSLRVRFGDYAFHPGYLRRYLAIPSIRHYFQVHSIGSTMANLNSRILLNMPLLLPELPEQAAISQQCDECEDQARLRGVLIERQVSLLRERRQALITGAVTGQFDVSTASGRNVTEGISV